MSKVKKLDLYALKEGDICPLSGYIVDDCGINWYSAQCPKTGETEFVSRTDGKIFAFQGLQDFHQLLHLEDRIDEAAAVLAEAMKDSDNKTNPIIRKVHKILSGEYQ